MTHISRISVARADATSGKQMDPAGALFLQLWITVMTWMMMGAFGKNR